MRTFLLSFLIVGALAFTKNPSATSAPSLKFQDSVYICVSKSAYAYHNTYYCSGLGRCTHNIKKITESQAINNYKRRKCKICY